MGFTFFGGLESSDGHKGVSGIEDGEKMGGRAGCEKDIEGTKGMRGRCRLPPKKALLAAVRGIGKGGCGEYGGAKARKGHMGGGIQRRCGNCGTATARQWLKGRGCEWLCHPCGQYWRKNGRERPCAFWGRPTLTRTGDGGRRRKGIKKEIRKEERTKTDKGEG